MKVEVDIRCKGCLSYDIIESSPISNCLVLYEKGGMYCPCINCVVKMMCETPCDAFDNWDIYLNGGQQ